MCSLHPKLLKFKVAEGLYVHSVYRIIVEMVSDSGHYIRIMRSLYAGRYCTFCVYYQLNMICNNIMVEWLQFLLRIREVPCSNLSTETGCRVVRFSSVPPGDCRYRTLKLAHERFLRMLCNSSFTYHPSSLLYRRGDHNAACESHAAHACHWCGSCNIPLIMFGTNCREQNTLFD
jgi:hypothetical protein